MSGRTGRRVALTATVVVIVVVVASGCTDRTPSAFRTHGDQADRMATVGGILFVLAGLVFVIVMGLILWSALGDRDRTADPGAPAAPGGPDRFVLIGGVALPAVVLAFVGFMTVRTTNELRAEPPDALRIEVQGAQWFWRVRYPGGGDGDAVVTANEVHVPVDRPVHIALTSEDVIHSFWIPQLATKTDLIPGQVNDIHFTATDAGIYRGTCAEYCGLQHAHMAFVVVADPPERFAAWLDARRRAPAAPAAGSMEAAGQAAFTAQACAGCHRVAGTTAAGTVGPDLTDVGARRELAAGTLPNTPDALRRFITAPQDVKPGNRMPALDLPPAQVDAIVAYLRSLDSGGGTP